MLTRSGGNSKGFTVCSSPNDTSQVGCRRLVFVEIYLKHHSPHVRPPSHSSSGHSWIHPILHPRHTPRPPPPEQAKLAVQIVINYEEGAENCVLHAGDTHSEVRPDYVGQNTKYYHLSSTGDIGGYKQAYRRIANISPNRPAALQISHRPKRAWNVLSRPATTVRVHLRVPRQANHDSDAMPSANKYCWSDTHHPPRKSLNSLDTSFGVLITRRSLGISANTIVHTKSRLLGNPFEFEILRALVD